MEDTGGIIFYIIVAIIGIIGAVNRRKKKQNSAREVVIPSQTIDEEEIFEDITLVHPFDNVERTADDQNGIPVFAENEIAAGPERDLLLKDNSSEPVAGDFRGEGVSEFKVKYTDNEKPTEDETDYMIFESHEPIEEQSVAAQIAADFDLPKAIVYSEILQRKDY